MAVSALIRRHPRPTGSPRAPVATRLARDGRWPIPKTPLSGSEQSRRHSSSAIFDNRRRNSQLR